MGSSSTSSHYSGSLAWRQGRLARQARNQRGEKVEGHESRRVLLVCGPAAGGMRRHVESLAERLPFQGFEVAVATPATVSLEPLVAWFPFELGDRPRPLVDVRAWRALHEAVRYWGPTV